MFSLQVSGFRRFGSAKVAVLAADLVSCDNATGRRGHVGVLAP